MEDVLDQLIDIADLVDVAQKHDLNDHQRMLLLKTIDRHLQKLITSLDD